MSIINANGWLPVSVTQQRSITAPAVAELATASTYVPQPSTLVTSASQTQAGNGSSQQSFQDNLDEAMAKLKVELDNLDPGDERIGKTAAEEFRDWMAKSPEEKIREKMLADLGLTEEEYEALPPEMKEGIDKKIAELTKQETEQKAMATLEPYVKAMTGVAQNLVGALTETAEQKGWKDPRENKDPLT